MLINGDYDLPPYISHIDSMRVCAAIEKAIEKLQLLNMLTTDVSSLSGESSATSSADGSNNQSQFNVVVRLILRMSTLHEFGTDIIFSSIGKYLGGATKAWSPL